MHAYLHRFLTSSDLTFQHIAVWTIVQLLESRGQLPTLSSYRLTYCADAELTRKIRESPLLLPSIQDLAVSQPSSPNTYSRTQSDSISEDGEGNGQEEITLLAKKIIQYANGDMDSDADIQGNAIMHDNVGGRAVGERVRTPRAAESAASSVSRRVASQLPVERDAELRRSVRDALGSSGDEA